MGYRETMKKVNSAPKIYEILTEETVYQGFFKVNKYNLRHQLFKGGWSEPMNREVFERGDAVAVMLLDPQRQCVVMAEQFRPGTLRHKHDPWLIEPVAGMIEDGESPAEVVRRETMEEAGCKIQKLRKICEYLVSPGGCSEKIWLYLAEVDAEEALAFGGLADENEDIKIHCIPIGELFLRMERGEFDNAMSLIGLQWLKLQLLENADLWPENLLE